MDKPEPQPRPILSEAEAELRRAIELAGTGDLLGTIVVPVDRVRKRALLVTWYSLLCALLCLGVGLWRRDLWVIGISIVWVVALVPTLVSMYRERR